MIRAAVWFGKSGSVMLLDPGSPEPRAGEDKMELGRGAGGWEVLSQTDVQTDRPSPQSVVTVSTFDV